MIRVIAVITALPGKRDELLALFEANIPAVRAEKGCIEYAPWIDRDVFGPHQAPYGPDTFVVLEQWATPEDLVAHSKAAHMIEYGRKSKPLVADRKIHVLGLAG